MWENKKQFNSNNTIICLNQAADMFNKHFLTLTDKLKLDYIDISSAMSFLQSSFPKGFPKSLKIHLDISLANKII